MSVSEALDLENRASEGAASQKTMHAAPLVDYLSANKLKIIAKPALILI